MFCSAVRCAAHPGDDAAASGGPVRRGRGGRRGQVLRGRRRGGCCPRHPRRHGGPASAPAHDHSSGLTVDVLPSEPCHTRPSAWPCRANPTPPPPPDHPMSRVTMEWSLLLALNIFELDAHTQTGDAREQFNGVVYFLRR